MRNNTYIRFEVARKRWKGYVATKELLEAGFSNRQIAVLSEEGYLEKICHGYYWLADRLYEKPADHKCIEICLSNPKSVICMDSALYYQGVIEKEPEYLEVATARTDRSALKMNFPVKRHYFSGNHFQVGMETAETEFGWYHYYNVERSICDMSRLGIVFDKKVINAIMDKRQQAMRLMKYAELLRVKNLQ